MVWTSAKNDKTNGHVIDINAKGRGGTLEISLVFQPLVLDFELLLVVLATGETLLLCPLVVAGEGVWLD